MDEQDYLVQNAKAATKTVPGLKQEVDIYNANLFDQFKRDWNPKGLAKRELPEYLKRDPVLWRFFARLNYEDKNFLALVVGDTGTGKCLVEGSKVLMSTGEWKDIEDVKIGDKVISPNSNFEGSEFATVVDIDKYKSDDIYEVRTNKNQLLYTCTGNHKIPIYYYYFPRNSNGARDYKDRETKIRVREAADLAALSDATLHCKGIRTRQGTLIEKFEKMYEPAIDPYFLGVFLGDGCFSDGKRVSIASETQEIIDRTEKSMKIYNAVRQREGTPCKGYFVPRKHPYKLEMERLGLAGKKSGTKFIPKECLFTSVDFRLNLLAGLIDTDGSITADGIICHTTKSKQMAEDMIFLIRSLGGMSRLKWSYKSCPGMDKPRKYYCFKVELGDMLSKLVLSKSNKKELLAKRLASTKLKLNTSVVSFYVKKTKRIENVVGITLDNESKLFITDNFMVTHNSCSAISLARALDITPLGGGRFKHNFKITSDETGRGTPQCRVVFGPSDFLKLIKSGLPRGSIIVWDEAGVGNDATKWQDKKSQLIKHIMQTFRSRNYGVFLTVPDKESITLATRRLVHCYVEMTSREANHACAKVTWAQRSRSREKTETFYKYPVFVDPETGKYKKILTYKIPRLDRKVEAEYNRIKDTTLQNLYEFYQREMDFIDKELGLKEDEQNKISEKVQKFNMAKCLEMCKPHMKELNDDEGDWSEAKIMLLLSKKNYECNKAQAKLLIELFNSD